MVLENILQTTNICHYLEFELQPSLFHQLLKSIESNLALARKQGVLKYRQLMLVNELK